MPGCEPDTMETLEADGLIEWRDDDTILVMQRDDPRVVAWQVGVNEYLRAAGEPPAFDEVSEPIVDPIGEPRGSGPPQPGRAESASGRVDLRQCEIKRMSYG